MVYICICIVFYVRGKFLKFWIFFFNIYNLNLFYFSYLFVFGDISFYIVCLFLIYMLNICWISGIIFGLVYLDKEIFEVC